MSWKARFAAGGLLLPACSATVTDRGTDLPQIELSADSIDFGEVNWGSPVTRDLTIRNSGGSPMGIGEIALIEADGFESNFSIVYDFAEASCDTAVADKGVAPDTGYYDDEDTAVAAAEPVLGAGCELPAHVTFDPVSLGAVETGIHILTVDEPNEQDRSFFRDPDDEFEVVVLEGNAVHETGRIFVEQTRLDFGFVWAGQSEARQTIVRNLGEEDLTLGGVEIDPTYADQFRLGSDDLTGVVLPPGGSTLVEIWYSPLTVDDVRRQPDSWFAVLSDDPNLASDKVQIVANQTGLVEDTPPEVRLIGPEVGQVVDAENVELELKMWDANQPAQTLGCRVLGDKLSGDVPCVPENESGHVFVQVPTSALEAGVSTLQVEVWDAFGQKAGASTTILFNTEVPGHDLDADGDGYTSDLDCRDTDAHTYPGATEIPDGWDNDCELPETCVPSPCAGLPNSCVDEGTTLGDDDGDCYVEADGGDCNDNDITTNLGASEGAHPDYRDNDCDGEIDEGTSNDDQDGDGFTGLNGDCDDDDASFLPGGVELCDGEDNDCDGIADDGGACVATNTIPTIVGDGIPTHTDIVVGQSVNIGVVAFDPDGDPLTYAWSQDTALQDYPLGDVNSPVITFTAPSHLPGDVAQATYSLLVEVNDGHANSVWTYADITIHSEAITGSTEPEVAPAACSAGTGRSRGFGGLLLLVVACRRRPGRRAVG